MHEHHLAVWISFAYRFQTAGDIYVIFWKLLAQIVISLFLLLLQLQKAKSRPYFVHLCLFIVSPQQLLNPLAYFNHILQRNVELLGVVSCCNLLENRRKDVLCTSENPCCMLALGKVQTGN